MQASIIVGSQVSPTIRNSFLSTFDIEQRKGCYRGVGSISKLFALSSNGSAPSSTSFAGFPISEETAHKRGSVESLFCYDKSVPEEKIENPVGVSLAEKSIGQNIKCAECEAKGAVLCATCAGSGLYVDAILESQGIIVKVRCLGCGGTGNMMCGRCGGRGHLGVK